MCWTTNREASEAAVAAAAVGRSSDSDSFRDRPIHTNDNDNNSPAARLFARRYRHAVRSFVLSFVLFVHCEPLLCSSCNNHHGIFRPDIFHREEGLYQSTGSVALVRAVETIKSTTTNHNHIGSDRFSAASMHDQKGGVKWSGVELLMAGG